MVEQLVGEVVVAQAAIELLANGGLVAAAHLLNPSLTLAKGTAYTVTVGAGGPQVPQVTLVKATQVQQLCF
jgi:hypothetical protein